jgi:hypothetical protein
MRSSSCASNILCRLGLAAALRGDVASAATRSKSTTAGLTLETTATLATSTITTTATSTSPTSTITIASKGVRTGTTFLDVDLLGPDLMRVGSNGRLIARLVGEINKCAVLQRVKVSAKSQCVLLGF